MGINAKDAVILLVEDNKDDEDLTLLALKENKVKNQVVVVRDGKEAIEYLHCEGTFAGRQQVNPQLILLDLKLPKISGIEVLKRLRANNLTKMIPVVILTTSKEDRDLIEGYSFGANSYIRKPVDFLQFAEAVRQLSTYWLVLNEFPPASGISP